MTVRAVMIVEMAGRPASHLAETLEKYAKQMEKLKGVSDVEYNFGEPKEIENSNGMFTAFAEIEFSAENYQKVTDLIFDFMPSSIEILEPSTVSMDLSEATSFLNTIAGRLHKYDEIARIAQIRAQQMAQQMQLMQQKLAEEHQKDAKSEEKKVEKKAVKKKKN